MLKENIQSLITAANAATGKTDTDMTAATQSLIDGFGVPENHGLADFFSGKTDSIVDDHIDNIRAYGFNDNESVTSVHMPNVVNIAVKGFASTPNLKTAIFEKSEIIGERAFTQSALEKIDTLSLKKMDGVDIFWGASNLTTVILRANVVCVLSAASTFANTPISSGTGYIYVPKALVEQYKVATNWVTYASQFRTIEDYPDITGGAV